MTSMPMFDYGRSTTSDVYICILEINTLTLGDFEWKKTKQQPLINGH